MDSAVIEETFAKAHWRLYMMYGFKPYRNWLTGKVEQVQREDTLNLLKRDSCRQLAEESLTAKERKATEIRSLLLATQDTKKQRPDSNAVAIWECVVTEVEGDVVHCLAYPLDGGAWEVWEIEVPGNKWQEGHSFYFTVPPNEVCVANEITTLWDQYRDFMKEKYPSQGEWKFKCEHLRRIDELINEL